MSASTFPENLTGKCLSTLHDALGFLVFLLLDFVDALLCVLYRFLDHLIEGKPSSCYCSHERINGEEEDVASETLFGRKNAFWRMGLLRLVRKWELSWKIGLGFSATKRSGAGGGKLKNRWSDCGCESCVFWTTSGDDLKLHVVVTEPSSQACKEDGDGRPLETVIFLHGFMSSSSFWTETVFRHLPERVRRNYRLVAIDLLGFGESPKPGDCLYTLNDHVEMIEKSVVSRFGLSSGPFHVVAHSMGCIVALALAAKYSKAVETVTLVAPPYYSASEQESSLVALNGLAGKKLWPPLAFGSAVMSWYEHIGRCVCLLVCRNHRTWEKILKLITGKRELPFTIVDMTKHTHHSAWHSMHNVICGGARCSDGHLETLVRSGARIRVVQGDRDVVVPLDCHRTMKVNFPAVELEVVAGADHVSVVIGREEAFVEMLEKVWEG